jgi:hypothetical protein
VTRGARILPGPRCGWPDRCSVRGVDHSPEVGTRRLWTYHDRQCQVPNPRPGAHLDGYPECGLIDLHAGDHDYRRHAAEGFIREPEAGTMTLPTWTLAYG